MMKPGSEARERILILGYGEMGHAMEFLLGHRHDLLIWEKYPQPGFQSVVLEETVTRTVLDKATVTDKPMTFQEIMNPPAAESETPKETES